MLSNVTLSAEKTLIAAARERARKEKTTLNAAFREWLKRYAVTSQERKARAKAFRDLMKSLEYAQPGRKFTREEMNER